MAHIPPSGGRRPPVPTPHRWIMSSQPYRAGAKAPSGPGSLAQNEIPAPSPAAVAAVSAAARHLNRYPDPLATRLRDRLARLHSVDADRILIGSGSDELLFLLAAAFGGPGRTFCCADPPYWGHEHPARMSGADMVKVPLLDFRHDLLAMAVTSADIAYVCNPHNPTGTGVTARELAAFVARARAPMIVIDEAYIEFADHPELMTAIPLTVESGVAVLRTFSKYYGLAGARVGYLVGSAELVATLRTVRAPFSVNHLAEVAALAALDDHAHSAEVRRTVRRNRPALIRIFAAAGMAAVGSQTNFVLILCPDEEDVLGLLREHGVSARPGTDLGLPGTIRVTVPDDAGLALVSTALQPIIAALSTRSSRKATPS